MSRRPQKLRLIRQSGGFPRGDDPSLPAVATGRVDRSIRLREEREVLRLCVAGYEWRTLLRERCGGWPWLWTDPRGLA